MNSAIVEVRGVTKVFASTRALSDVSLTIGAGEVHGLVGRNGAGKSTLVAAMSGLIRPDSGAVLIDGSPAWQGTSQETRAAFGKVAVVHQTPALVDSLSVAENLHLEPELVPSRYGFLSWRRLNREAETMLAHWDLKLNPRQLVADLGPAERQLLAIARAMSRDASVIILDEPTAALPIAEAELLFARLRALRRKGMAFVYISHHLEEVAQICDRATILRDGEVIATKNAGELGVSDLVALVAGRRLNRLNRPTYVADQRTPILLALKHLKIQPNARGIDLEMRGGEAHALVGILGSGAERLGQIIAGAAPAFGGTVSFVGSPLPLENRSASVVAGVGYVPADRHADGYVGVLGVRENVALSCIDNLSNRAGFVERRAEAALADRAIVDYCIKVASREQAVGSLSGGNQQKVVIARALARNPRLLVAIHPTRGVDVGAKESIYELLRAYVKRGNLLILVTDELDEVDALASTVTVLREGDAVVTQNRWTHEELLLAMEGTV
ncbi:MAG: Rhamnose transport system ATP-binding protein [Subtercola sp.]|nr:Rhamnose transport system ATP-binding protein [Subtercola sp.]